MTLYPPMLGDRLIEGSSTVYSAYRESAAYAALLLRRLQATHAYACLPQTFSKEAIDAYLMYHLWWMIRPWVYQNHGSTSEQELAPLNHLYTDEEERLLLVLLQEIWKGRALHFARPATPLPIVGRLSQQAKGLARATLGLVHERAQLKNIYSGSWRIGIEAWEGSDESRRSDLYWLSSSNIALSRLLVCFRIGTPASKETWQSCEEYGISRICMQRGFASQLGQKTFWHYWGADPQLKPFIRNLKRNSGSDITAESLMQRLGLRLLHTVGYWRVFFSSQGVRIWVSTAVEPDTLIAQRLALDLQDGIMIGAQRSVIPTRYDTNGTRPQHVFFVWGDVEHAFDCYSHNLPKTAVRVGFCYDYIFKQQDQTSMQALKQQLHTAGVTFSVALLDNAFGDFYLTRLMIVKLYRGFLQWVLDNPSVGLVLKPKKPDQFAELREIKSLLEQARATGRCILLENALGRLPSDASCCTDLSVGIPIASTIIEAAIRGKRAIAYDPTGQFWHPLYTWGRSTTVFNDLNELLEAIEQYRNNPAYQPLLGDFSHSVDAFDPFRDGKAVQRIGDYMHRLMLALDQGCGAKEALARTNEYYSQTWGEQHINFMDDAHSYAEHEELIAWLETQNNP